MPTSSVRDIPPRIPGQTHRPTVKDRTPLRKQTRKGAAWPTAAACFACLPSYSLHSFFPSPEEVKRQIAIEGVIYSRNKDCSASETHSNHFSPFVSRLSITQHGQPFMPVSTLNHPYRVWGTGGPICGRSGRGCCLSLQIEPLISLARPPQPPPHQPQQRRDYDEQLCPQCGRRAQRAGYPPHGMCSSCALQHGPQSHAEIYSGNGSNTKELFPT